LNPAFSPEEQAIVKSPSFFLWWIKIGYDSLCIPFKPVVDTCERRYNLQSSNPQKVNHHLNISHFFQKQSSSP